MQQKTENENMVKELPEFLSNLYKKNLTIVKCQTCESDLQSGKLFHYRHLKDNGWVVPGFEQRQWLFLVCPKCHHQLSLNKLGIDKEFQIDSIEYEKAKGKFYRDMVFCNECKKAIEISIPDKYEALKNHTNIFHPWLFGND